MDVYFSREIGDKLLAGVILVLDTTQAHGPVNVDYCKGVVAMARHQALAFGLSWPAIAGDARQAIVGDARQALGRLPELEDLTDG